MNEEIVLVRKVRLGVRSAELKAAPLPLCVALDTTVHVQGREKGLRFFHVQIMTQLLHP